MHPPVCATQTTVERSYPPQSSFETLPAGLTRARFEILTVPPGAGGAENEPVKPECVRDGTFREGAGQ